MANPEHVAKLKEGVKAWNEWRRNGAIALPALPDGLAEDAIFIDLPTITQGQIIADVILFAAHQPRFDLRGAQLSGKNLREANLSDTDLTGADLRKTDLAGARLKGADLSHADMDDSVLTRAILVDALLLGTKLADADMDGVLLYKTTFSDVDLSTTKNLNTVRAAGPSSIGLDTVYRSGGKIPESFLRSAGVPENFITFAKSLTGAAPNFFSVFISYGSQDQEFASRLHADLQNAGVRCWFAPHDLKIGDLFRNRIEESIRLHDKLLVVLSENSIQSPWVATEVESAFEREYRQKDEPVLFPIRLDESVMKTDQAWAADIRRTRHIGDFSKWKDPDSYQKAFDRLLRDLKAYEAKAQKV